MSANKTDKDEQILLLLRQEAHFDRGFRLLMSTYQERLYWHIRRMVDSHADADDVLQNTLIKIYKGILRFEGKSALFTWLYRIATNESLSFLQSKKRRQASALDDPDSNISSNLTADSWFDGDAAQEKLQHAIAALPEKQRAVFTMRYFEEMPYHEMAEIMETSVGALKASFHHASKKIERFFQESN
ncbi:MAG: RNA polymerase sigma factor [Saprospiraceae bacterium]|jgi:RNA polymerase sigma-70 factor (ECF subfamily)